MDRRPLFWGVECGRGEVNNLAPGSDREEEERSLSRGRYCCRILIGVPRWQRRREGRAGGRGGAVMGGRSAFDEIGGGGRGRGSPDGIAEQMYPAGGSTTMSCRLRERDGQRPSAKEEEARNNQLNQLTYDKYDDVVHRARSRDRRARVRQRAPAGLPMAPVTTLGSWGVVAGRWGAQRRLRRQNGVTTRRRGNGNGN